MAKPSRYTSELTDEYVDKGYWQRITFADFWDRNAREHPDSEAVVDSRTRLTWAQAKQWIDRLAFGLLERGFARDDTLVLQIPNSVELTLLRVAAEKAGLVCLPALRTLRHSEMENILRFTEAVGIVVLWKYRNFNYIEMLREIKPRLPQLKYILVAGDEVPEGTISLQRILDSPLEKKYPENYLESKKTPWNEFSLVGHTSGTTGFPKFIEYPICSSICMAAATVRVNELTEADIIAALSPAAMGPSVIAHMCAPIVGAKIVMVEHFEAEEALRIIEREKVTVIGAVPAQLAMMIACPTFNKYDLSSLRMIRCTGSPLAYDLGVTIEGKMKAKLVQGYGAADFSSVCSTSFSDSRYVRLLTTGKPLPGNEVKLVDDSGKEVRKGEVGEIWARGPNSASGFFKDTASTERMWEGGWYRTGDLGKFDEQENMKLVGRKKDMIIRGGQNIYPAEVEAIMVAHPRILEVAVVGIPDEVLGERACAFVVPKPGEQISLEEIVSFLKSREIAPFKIPERLEIIEKLPMVADGQKVDKKSLAQLTAEKLPR